MSNDTQDVYMSPPFIFSEPICLRFANSTFLKKKNETLRLISYNILNYLQNHSVYVCTSSFMFCDSPLCDCPRRHHTYTSHLPCVAMYINVRMNDKCQPLWKRYY